MVERECSIEERLAQEMSAGLDGEFKKGAGRVDSGGQGGEGSEDFLEKARHDQLTPLQKSQYRLTMDVLRHNVGAPMQINTSVRLSEDK